MCETGHYRALCGADQLRVRYNKTLRAAEIGRAQALALPTAL